VLIIEKDGDFIGEDKPITKKKKNGFVDILNLSYIGINNRHFLQEPRRESDLGD
jgi:hypothetical protein